MIKITFKSSILDNYGWTWENETREFMRVSRWIKINTDYNITPRHSLYVYAEDENGRTHWSDDFDAKTAFVDYFVYKGRKYAMGQFISLGNPFYCPVMYSYEDEDGREAFLSGYDSTAHYKPIYIEIDSVGERVRVYQEVE